MDSRLFTSDYQDSAYWLDDIEANTALADARQEPATSLPAQADVVVIGSGYTGLHAALPLARSGRDVVVFEAGEVGQGCSRRNGGQVSNALKPDLATLTRRYGYEVAMSLLREGFASVDWLESFVKKENIDCQFKRCGSFHGAHSARQFGHLCTTVEEEHPELSTGAWIVEPSELHKEIGTSAYYGGAVFPREGSLHPALYHHGLVNKVRNAGVAIFAHCPVTQLETQGGKVTDRVRVETSRGSVLAREVIVATNGYTGKATPWLQRRVIPIGSYMLATEPLPAALIDQLLPTDRMVHDTRKVVYYYRPSPDRRRVIFGGRVSAGEVTPDLSGPLLHRSMCRLFPQLSHTRISHSWMGKVGFTFDDLPHMGSEEHVHYALGYCGSGIAMSSYMGWQLGELLIHGKCSKAGVASVPNGIQFESRFYYKGSPWFLGAAIRYFQLCDRLS